MKNCFYLLLLATLGVNAQNTPLGSGAGTGGAYNVSIGTNAGTATVAPNGNRNTFVGYEAGISNTSGRENTYIGDNVGRMTSTDSENTMVGRASGMYHTGSQNTFMGYKSGMGLSNGSSTGGNNSFFGYYSGLGNTTGEYNTFIGRSAGYGNTGGGYNTSIGTSSGYALASGMNNVFLGVSAGLKTNANNNVFLGFEAGRENVSGAGNVFIGFQAGQLETGSNKLYIANRYTTLAGGQPPLLYGEFDNRYLRFNVNQAATSTVEIIGYGSVGSGNSGLRFNKLTSTFNPGATNTATKFLTVDDAGTVILRNLPSGITAGPDTSIYLNDGQFVNTTNNRRVVDMLENDLYFRTSDSGDFGRVYIGNQIDAVSFPQPGMDANFRLYVEKGILTEKVKVALRSTNDWADYVFAEGYQLKPLSEVAAFIEENKHLPGVASAEELKNNGLDLGAMQAKQMEKIEELTLYAIEQDKMIESQKKALEKQAQEISEIKAMLHELLSKKQ